MSKPSTKAACVSLSLLDFCLVVEPEGSISHCSTEPNVYHNAERRLRRNTIRAEGPNSPRLQNTEVELQFLTVEHLN